MYLTKLSYDQYMDPYAIDSFLVDLFNSGAIKVKSGDHWGSLGSVTKVFKEETLHTITSLNFFEKLNKILHPTGDIKKCLDEYVESFIVCDELRKCLLCQEDPLYDLFSPEERQEFIFHLFKALCLGGSLCQFEDQLQPYLDATKKMYKDLVCVVKENGKLKVGSLVYKITGVEATNPLFPLSHPQNFCYVMIDPYRRHVNILYHASNVYY